MCFALYTSTLFCISLYISFSSLCVCVCVCVCVFLFLLSHSHIVFFFFCVMCLERIAYMRARRMMRWNEKNDDLLEGEELDVVKD